MRLSAAHVLLGGVSVYPDHVYSFQLSARNYAKVICGKGRLFMAASTKRHVSTGQNEYHFLQTSFF